MQARTVFTIIWRRSPDNFISVIARIRFIIKQMNSMGQKKINKCPKIANGYVYGTPVINIHIQTKLNTIKRK